MSTTDQHGLECACGATFETPDDLQDHVQKQKWQPDPTQGDTRNPTDEELEALTQWYQTHYGMGREEAVTTINQTYVLVIDNYTTGCPGYAGPILIQIGDAGPSMHHIFRWNNDNELVHCEQAEELRSR